MILTNLITVSSTKRNAEARQGLNFSTALETLEAFFHMVASCISNSYVLQTGFELIMCLLTGNCGQIQNSHTPKS